MARSSRSAFDSHPLRKRLAAVRRRLRLVVLLRGLGWLSALLLLTLLGVGLLDWTLHLPSVVRALVLVGTLAAAGVVAARSLLKPFFARMDDLTLALRIEERYPSLNDSLASTVEFLEQAEKNLAEGNRGPGTLAVSASMRREAVKRALQKSEGCDFNRVIDSRGLKTAGISGLAATLAAVLMLLLFPAFALTAFARLADPFGKHDWPRATQIELEEYRQRIGRNETFEVKGNVRGVIPDKAIVLFRPDGGTPIEHEVRVARDSSTKVGQLVAQFRPEKLSRNFSFQVKANDAETDWLRVEVAPAPKLATLDGKPSPQVSLQYPRYTELTARALPEGVGSIDAIAGTTVTLRAAANVPLRAAWIRYVPEPSHTSPLAAVGVFGSVELANVLTAAAVDEEINGRHYATLSADRLQFSLRFTPVVSGAYELHFEDDTGLRDQRSYELLIRPDPTPTVVLDRPSEGKENLSVLPGATLPLLARAEDPTFALRGVWLEYRLNAEPPWRRVPLFDHHQAARDLVVAPLSWAGVIGTSSPLKPMQLSIERPLRIAQFRHPNGSPLKEGDQLTVRIAADDFDDVTHGKLPGYSREIEIHIISRAVLDIALNKEQTKLEQDLREIRNQERDAIRKINELENRAAATKKLTPEDLAELARTEQTQQQVRERLDSPEQDSVRSRIERLLETLKQNDLNHTGVEQRLESLQADLNRLGREQLEQIEARLANVRKLGEVPEDARKEKQAESLDKAAEKADAQAHNLQEQASARPENDPQRARLQEDARTLKEEAGKLREMAAKMREEGKQPPQPQDAEARAKERAKLLEEMAKERDRQARQQEKLAGEDATGKEREKLKLAEEMKEEARTLREQARAQDAAARGGDQNELKAGLNEARRRQEEVERTLGEMLQRLEPWSSTRETKGEARALLEEQRRLQDEVEAMQKQGLTGLPREKLTDEQRARLDNTIAQQQKLKERAQQFLDQMKRLAEDRKDKDPAAAEEMRAAIAQAEKGNIPGQMKMAQEQLEQNQLNRAGDEQRGAVKSLEDLVKNLDDRRTDELDRLVKNLKDAEKKVEKLFEEQERLKKKIKDAAKLEDPKKREEELKKLTAEQQKLQKETEEAAKQLSRMRSERSADALDKAAKEMAEAVRRLERGEDPQEKQEEALDRLDEAAMGLEKQRNENEEELAREQLAKIADTLKRLKERQDRMVEEGGRIRKEVLEQKKWTRGLIISLGDLGRAQEGLADESASIAERDLPGAPIFARMLRKAVESMKKASESMARHREKVRQEPDGTESDAVAERAQADAKRRLDQLVEALKMDKGAQVRRTNNQPPGDGGMEGGGGGAPGDGIPTLAQLKLLRAMQADINERTREFHKTHPDPAKLTEEEKKELQALSKEEREIAELLEEYARPEAGEGDVP